MYIIGLNGSPHREGNTAFLLENALEAAEEEGANTEILFCQEILQKMEKPFCVACETPCAGKCYAGTEYEQVLEKIGSADGLLLASPVYFGSISTQLKGVWDKTRRLRREKKLLNVVGGAITVGAARFGGQETTIKAMHSLMLIQSMLIVGDCYEEKAPGHHGVCAQAPSREDSYAVKRAIVLGKRMAQVCQSTASLRSHRK